MSLRSKVKQLFVYHETTRLLIKELEVRHVVMRKHLIALEEKIEERSK